MNQMTNVARAISGARRRVENKHRSLSVFTMALFATFMAIELIAIVIGTMGYRSIHAAQSAEQASSHVLGPIISAVRSNDAEDAVAVGQGPEGRSLVLVNAQDDSTYETRIYLYEGSLVEEYSLAGTAYTPAKATRIATTSTFDFSYENGLLSVFCDQGTARVALRSARGGETS